MVNGHGDSNFSVIRPAILDMTNLERYAIFQFNNGYVSDLGGAACLLVHIASMRTQTLNVRFRRTCVV